MRTKHGEPFPMSRGPWMAMLIAALRHEAGEPAKGKYHAALPDRAGNRRRKRSDVGAADRDRPDVQRGASIRSACRTRGSPVTWPATRSTACTRPRTPTPSWNTPDGAASRRTGCPWWPTSSGRRPRSRPRSDDGIPDDGRAPGRCTLPGARLTWGSETVHIDLQSAREACRAGPRAQGPVPGAGGCPARDGCRASRLSVSRVSASPPSWTPPVD